VDKTAQEQFRELQEAWIEFLDAWVGWAVRRLNKWLQSEDK